LERGGFRRVQFIESAIAVTVVIEGLLPVVALLPGNGFGRLFDAILRIVSVGLRCRESVVSLRSPEGK